MSFASSHQGAVCLLLSFGSLLGCPYPSPPSYDVAIDSGMEEELQSVEWVKDQLALCSIEMVMGGPLHLFVVFPSLVTDHLVSMKVQVLLYL